MSNELTDVRCPCGAEFQADSYDAGFIAGSGMCQNCDAALPPKDICTCPSGDGSLRHPCPVHPASGEQAGGDERDFQAKGAQEVPSPVSKEYDRHLISLLRKGEALPGHQEEAADEIERLRDWNDHLNNTVLPNILNPNFLMLMKGGERLLDLCTKDGKFIGVSLNDMKDVFDWMVTHARIAPDHAALAQPSPAQAEQAEAERPIVSFEKYMQVMYDRDENAKRLDAALARVAELERGKVYVEARQCDECQHGGINDSATGVAACHECDWTGPEPEEDRCPGCQRENCMAAACPQCGARYVLVASEEIAAPVAQAQQLNDLDKQCRDDVARALGLRPNQERGFAWSYLLASIKSCVKASGDSTQAQHSVPEVSGIGRDFAHPRSVVLYLRTEPTDDDLRAIHDGLRSLAAAPGKEGNDD
ncbi:hypothetical protein [Pseudomonas aeruginosa]|uniref:hypothetical protein n=1 Tax=Pseudomonas aeruginosa TaxID=287 RepID=UPI001C12FFF3|nr:hypothetical protein [Pseudomonas aeruginosa]